MKKIKLGKKTYLTVFVFVTVLNICLAVFLIRNVLAQNSDDSLTNQLPIVAQVVEQLDSPLRITIISVDNSAGSFQKVNYAVQNTANKPVRGYVILGSGKNTGKISTNFLPAKSFQVNASFTEELFVERENLKSDKTVSLSIDYVEFEDGTSWGEDTQGQSEYLAGGCAGAEYAAGQLINLIEKKETANLNAVLKKSLLDIEITLPEAFKTKSEKWQNGFRSGYKSIISFIKKQREKSDDSYLPKLREIKKNIELERRQKQ